MNRGTASKTLVGVFEDLWSHGEPLLKNIGFFARMTDLEGHYRFAIKVVRISTEGEIVVANGGIPVEQPITDRLVNPDIALNLPPTVFPTFGKYEFQLFSNDVYIERAVLNCRKLEAANQ